MMDVNETHHPVKDRRRRTLPASEWVEVTHLLVCPKNGKSLTNGTGKPNGAGLTSGPGMVNGMALTSQIPEPMEPERPTGFHLYPEEVSRRWEDYIPRGLGVRRNLINGLSIEVKRERWEATRGRWWLGRGRDGTKRRLEELAKAALPGDEGAGN